MSWRSALPCLCTLFQHNLSVKLRQIMLSLWRKRQGTEASTLPLHPTCALFTWPCLYCYCHMACIVSTKIWHLNNDYCMYAKASEWCPLASHYLCLAATQQLACCGTDQCPQRHSVVLTPASGSWLSVKEKLLWLWSRLLLSSEQDRVLNARFQAPG